LHFSTLRRYSSHIVSKTDRSYGRVMNCGLRRRCALTLAGLLGLAWTPWALPAQSPASPSSVNLNAGQRFAGYASCLARGCHGAPEVSQAGALIPAVLGNAGTVWINHDRHARAYAVLKTERSREILRKLANAGVLTSPVDLEKPRPEREARCLACHSTPALASAAATLNAEQLEASWAEGVSCDACHTTPGGDSWSWVDAHPRGELLAFQKDPGRGMRSLDTAAKRAQVCTGCHVGAPPDPATGIPLRDMDHTFIAAGHPRLFFDYATYLQLMPPHWQERSQTVNPVSKLDPTGAVAAQAAGSAAVLSAELELLADRAQQPDLRSGLSGMDCYACHHDLVSPSWRQRTTQRGKLGQASWQGEEVLASAAPWLRPAAGPARDALVTVSQRVPKFQVPDEQLIAVLQGWLDPWKTASITKPAPAEPGNLEALLPEWPKVELVTESGDTFAGLSWDQGARRYYQARELERIRLTVLEQPAATEDAEVAGALQALRESLTFQKSDPGLLSPRDYDPQVAGECYHRVRKLLTHRWEVSLQRRGGAPLR